MPVRAFSKARRAFEQGDYASYMRWMGRAFGAFCDCAQCKLACDSNWLHYNRFWARGYKEGLRHCG